MEVLIIERSCIGHATLGALALHIAFESLTRRRAPMPELKLSRRWDFVVPLAVQCGKSILPRFTTNNHLARSVAQDENPTIPDISRVSQSKKKCQLFL
jgi:hypothetical protein